VNCIKTSIL